MAAEQAPQLRTQLLRWLLMPLSLLLVADTFIGYWIATSSAERAHDRALVEIARDVALHVRPENGKVVLDLPEEARRVLFSSAQGRIAFEVLAADGKRIAGEAIPAAPVALRGRAEKLYEAILSGDSVRVAELDRPGVIVRVAETKEQRVALAREFLLSVLLPQVLLILIAGVVVWHGVVRGLAPLERLQRALGTRSHVDRSPVSAEGVPAEVRPLVSSINELLARLDRALTLQARFIADAAHQLKTPIAALRTQLEVALREQDPVRLREAVQASYPGLERLQRLASQLLSLARNEPEAAGRVKLAELDLNALGLEVATNWVPEALKRGIDLGFEASAAPARVRGDAARLRELLDNLLDNAVRYTRERGRITVRVLDGAAPALEVNDDGPSIPAEERDRVFERFHRLLGTSRDGSGLGLAIAREIARLHGAAIALRDDADGVGNTFTVTFPGVQGSVHLPVG
jgi:two-component system sensor histidine kinase TctE